MSYWNWKSSYQPEYNDYYNYNDYYSYNNNNDNSKYFTNSSLTHANKMILELKNNDEKNKYMYNLPPIEGRYVVVDTETTGFDRNEDQILEIAACEIINGELTQNEFRTYIKPRQKITNTFVHGISEKTFKNLPKNYVLDDIKNLENFIKFIGDSLIFAHNASFDMEFINHELTYWNLETINPYKFRCTMRIFYKYFCTNECNKINLDSCCNYFGIKCCDRHSALGDSISAGKLLVSMFKKINGNKNNIYEKHNLHTKRILKENNKNIHLLKQPKVDRLKLKKEIRKNHNFHFVKNKQ